MARWTTSGIGARRPTKDFARKLRREMSLPEVLLWVQLKGQRLEGLKFRKQHPVGPYILDFYCHDVRLALEVDGEGHSLGDRPERDAVRDAWLLTRGIRTLRLSATAVLDSMDDALRMIITEAAR